jgi:uncharacterized protein YlzI (FlbEa/FlbD family)
MMFIKVTPLNESDGKNVFVNVNTISAVVKYESGTRIMVQRGDIYCFESQSEVMEKIIEAERLANPVQYQKTIYGRIGD